MTLYVIVIVLNILWISFLFFKLKSITNNPSKYDVIPNYKEYSKSKWFWPTKKEPRKGDPPDLATVYFAPFFIGSAIYYFASSDLIYYSSMPGLENCTRFFGEDTWCVITFFMYALYSLLLSFYFPLFVKSPEAICFSIFHIFPRRSRADKWKKMTQFVLFATIFLFPFRIFALSNKGYVNTEEIVYHPFWSLEDQLFVFDEVVDIQVSVTRRGISHYYLVNARGQRFDISGNYVNIDNPEETTKNIILQLMPESLKEAIANKEKGVVRDGSH